MGQEIMPDTQPARQTLMDVLHLPREAWLPCGRRSAYLPGDVVVVPNNGPADTGAWQLGLVLESENILARTGLPIYLPGAHGRVIHVRPTLPSPVIMGDRAVCVANWCQAATLQRASLRRFEMYREQEGANPFYNPFPHRAIPGYRAGSRHDCAKAAWQSYFGEPFPKGLDWTLLEFMLVADVERWTWQQVGELAAARFQREPFLVEAWCQEWHAMIHATTPAPAIVDAAVPE